MSTLPRHGSGTGAGGDTTALFDIRIQTAPPAELLRAILGCARARASAGA